MADTDIKVAISAEDRTEAAFRSVESNIGKLQGRFSDLNALMAGFAGGIGAAVAENIGGSIIEAYKFVTKAAEDAAVSQRKLEAILRATGNTTGYTASQLNNLADKLARTTSFDDESFREATATIIRFGNITGDNLEKVLRLSADYAALTGGTVTSAAQMFARALNDPADGLKKLERNFGELRPATKAAVDELERIGDRSGAIALAIADLQSKIGGADESINTGLTGATKRLNKALGELAETLGGKLSGDGGLKNWFATQIERINTALNSTPMDRLTILAAVLSQPTRGGEVAAGFLDSLNRRATSPNLGLFSGMNTGLDGGDPTVTFGMGFYGPSNNDIEIERKRRQELLKIQTEYAKEVERLRKIHQAGEEAALIAEDNALNERMAALGRFGRERIKELERQELAAARLANSEADAAIQADERQRVANENLIGSVSKLIPQLEFELKIMALARPERERAIALRNLEAAGVDVTSQSALNLVNTLRDLYAQQEAIASQVSVWNQIGDAAGRFFSDVLVSGRSAFDSLKQMLRQFLAELVAFFAKRWVLQIAAGLTGSTALSAAAGQVGNGTFAGTIGNALLGASGIGLGTAGEFVAGAAGTFMGPTAAGSAAAMGAEFAAFMTNPATLAVLAAVVIAVAIMSRRGGPKDGGSAFGTFDANGNFVPGFAPGTENGRFYTPSGADSAMVSMTQGIGEAFAQTLARLGGGTGAGFGFGFGFDRDPRGTANSRVSGVVTNPAGETILEIINRDAGRSDEDLQNALQLIGRQSLLAALQRSQLPEAVLAILRTVDAASASADEIDGVLQLADAFVQLTATLGDISIEDVISRSSMTSVDAFRQQGTALLELASRTTLTTQSLATLAQATGSYRAAAESLIATLQATSVQINQLFGQTRRNITLAGLDPQARFNYFQQESADYYNRLLTAGTAEEVSRFVNTIVQNINDAFALLSPEDQARYRQQFLDGLDRVDLAANERIRTLQREARDEANRTLGEVRTILDDIAKKQAEAALAQQQAAAAQQTAADTQIAAANTPRTFNISVDVSRGAAVVTDGG